MEGEDYSGVTVDYLLKKMKQDKSVVAITSATPTVLGLLRTRGTKQENSLWMLVLLRKQPQP